MHLSVLSEDPVKGICRSTSTEQVNMSQDDETSVWYFQSAGLAELYKSVCIAKYSTLCHTIPSFYTQKNSLTFGSFTSSVLQTVLYILSQGSCKLLRLFIAGDAYRSWRKLCNDVVCRILLCFGADMQGDSISNILLCQFPQSSLTYAFFHGKYKLHKEISTKISDEVMKT